MTNNNVYVPKMNNVIISSHDGKKLVKFKDSSFLATATGSNDEEAIENLKKAYSQIFNRFQNSD